MRPYLKDSKLHLVLTKTERKKLSDAAGICAVISSMSPIDELVKDSATGAKVGIENVLAGCGGVEVEQKELLL